MRLLYKPLSLILLAAFLCSHVNADKERISTLYNSLDPKSVSQNFAFYDLYPDTAEGRKALSRGWQLLLKGETLKNHLLHPLSLPPCDIQAIISIVNKQSYSKTQNLTADQLIVIDKIASKLGNRALLGYRVENIKDLQKLPSEQIDIARSILLYQFKDMDSIRHYEANLDLMALQIGARLSKNASDEEKIKAINHFIFHEMQFRFPPHSLYAKDIDLYTFLPSVLDSRQGVCLGVSILFLSIAQRLELPLEIITPPGHIYLRYKNQDKIINIETTARGIDLPSETYLGLNTKLLHERSLKEVIGLSLINQASVFWARQDYKTTVDLYEKAFCYLKEDRLLKMLLGMNYLFCGQKEKGRKLLNEIKSIPFEDAVHPDSIPEDYLNEKVDIQGLKAIFLPVDETRESIIEKQKQLTKILRNHPKFRAGLLQLATTWMQLGRRKEALDCLNRYHHLDNKDPVIEYYLVHLNLQSLDYPEAWKHFKIAKSITQRAGHAPRALQQLGQHLMQVSPQSKVEDENQKNSFISFLFNFKAPS